MLSSSLCKLVAFSFVAAGLLVGPEALADEARASDDPFAEHTESAGRGEIGLSGSGGYGRTTANAGGASYDGTTYADASAFGRYYFRPLREMAGPRTYLPFLQRASSIAIGGSAGGSWTDPSITGQAMTGVSGGIGVNALLYVLPQLVLGPSLSYSQSSRTDRVTARRFVSPTMLVGLRTGDNLLSLDYSHTFAVVGGELQPTRFGSLRLFESILLDRQIALNAFFALKDRGLEAGGSAILYPIDELGIYAGGSGGRAAFDVTSENVYNLYQGYAGIAGWLTRYFRIEGTYNVGVGVNPTIQASRTSHTGTLSMVARIP